MHRPIPADVARRIRIVGFDVDGVLTDNGVYVGQSSKGETFEMKRFEVSDGLGLKMLAWAGLHVVLISGRHSEASALRAAELGIECFQDRGARKLPAMESLLARHGADWSEVAFVADDLADLPVLRRAALPIGVANAVPEVKARAHWVTTRAGGHGAAREVAETLLRARGEWTRLVEQYELDREVEVASS